MKNNYEWLDGYLLSKPGAVSEFKAEWGWLRYLVGGKQFAAVCTPGEAYKPHAGRTMVLLKCDPMLAELFRQQYLDGAVPEETLRAMCDMSYELVFAKLTKKAQREIKGE